MTVRRAELLKASSPFLLKLVVDHAGPLSRDGQSSLLVQAILQNCLGDRTEAFRAILAETESEDEPLIDHGAGHRMLQRLIALPAQGESGLFSCWRIGLLCTTPPLNRTLHRGRIGNVCQVAAGSAEGERKDCRVRLRQPPGLCADRAGAQRRGRPAGEEAGCLALAELPRAAWRQDLGFGEYGLWEPENAVVVLTPCRRSFFTFQAAKGQEVGKGNRYQAPQQQQQKSAENVKRSTPATPSGKKNDDDSPAKKTPTGKAGRREKK